eukprot:UN06739
MVFGYAEDGKKKKGEAPQKHCLGWTRFPIIDADSRSIQGLKTFTLWDIPLFKGSHEGPSEDPSLSQPFRWAGTTVNKTVKSYT